MPLRETASVVVLAAGGSQRMGRPKQLLPVGEQPLIRRVVERLQGPPVERVILVLGAEAPAVREALNGLPVHLVINPHWTEGLGSSVRLGLEALIAIDPAVTGVVLALGDQPDFSRSHVTRLLAARRDSVTTIVASSRAGVLQPPAYFSAMHFPELLALAGDAGARSLFARHAGEVAAVAADDLGDLDTPEEYAAYLAGQNLSVNRPASSGESAQ